MFIKQSTEHVYMFLMVLDTDYVTAATGKSPTVVISKAGGGFAAIANSVSQVGNGWYKFTLTTTETNTEGALVISATATGCAPWREKLMVVGDLADYIQTDLAATLDSTERNAIADHVIRRNFANVESSSDGDTLTQKSLIGAGAKLTHKVVVSGSNLVIYKTDGTTSFYSLPIVTSASAELITSQG